MDDAVLSSGGLIFQLTQAGEMVIVVTVMAGDVPPDIAISPFIEEHFRRWNLWPDPVPGRKAEDRRAVHMLGAEVHFGDIPDALYRTDGHGTALYPDLDTLFGEIDPRDRAPRQIHRWIDPAAALYAPLGAGHHVDHQLARDAASAWRHAHPEVAVFLYEEYPYSAMGADAIQAARVVLGEPTIPVSHDLSDAALAAKIRAIACYQSQISTFWDDVPAVAESVRQYAEQVGQGHCAERLWELVGEGKES
jgi:LmbE family N-acetylglucosaminyl deacetylase